MYELKKMVNLQQSSQKCMCGGVYIYIYTHFMLVFALFSHTSCLHDSFQREPFTWFVSTWVVYMIRFNMSFVFSLFVYDSFILSDLFTGFNFAWFVYMIHSFEFFLYDWFMWFVHFCHEICSFSPHLFTSGPPTPPPYTPMMPCVQFQTITCWHACGFSSPIPHMISPVKSSNLNISEISVAWRLGFGAHLQELAAVYLCHHEVCVSALKASSC